MEKENQLGSVFAPIEVNCVKATINPHQTQEETILNTFKVLEISDVTENENIEITPVKRHTINGEELLNRLSNPHPFLIQNLIHKGSINGLVGSSETGKSTFARDLSFAIVTKQELYLGRPLNVTHNNVIYVSTEDNQEMMKEYLHGRLKNGDPKLMKGFRMMEDCEKHQSKLFDELKHEPADLIVIDVFADLFSGDMNDAVSVRKLLNGYKRLADQFKVTFLILHHTGKRTEKLAPSKNNSLGSQGFESKMRLCFELRNDLQIDNKKHLCIVKANYLKPQDKIKSLPLLLNDDGSYTFLGEGVLLGNLAINDTRNINSFQEEGKIKLLRDQGLSIRKITDKLQEEGFVIGKTKVNSIIKSFPQGLDNGALPSSQASEN